MAAVFMGPSGLRAGWAILIFIAVVGGLLVLGASVLTYASGKGPDLARGRYLDVSKEIIPAMFKVVAVLLPACAMSLLERRQFGVYGLDVRHVTDILPGALTGLIAMSILVGVLAALHLLVFDARLLHGSAVFRSGGAWLFFYSLVGLYEELLFRGYVLLTLMRGLLGIAERISSLHARAIAFWLSAVACSLLFFLLHANNPDETATGLLGIFLFGILCSYALWRTGSLWWAIGFHMIWDWTESFLYGVPDSGAFSVGRLLAAHAFGNALLSGGVAGPEGSLLLLPVLSLIFLSVRLQTTDSHFPFRANGASD